MKVLFVLSAWGIGGEQRAASNLINKLILRGHSVEMITFKMFNKTIVLNPNVKISTLEDDFKLPFLKNINRMLKIRKIIKSEKYDAVIGFAIIPSILCSLAGIGLKSIVVISERSDPRIYNGLYKVSRSIAYRLADGGVFQTKAALDYFKGLKRIKKIVIPNPIEIDSLPDFHKGERSKRIVSIGRLVEVKNHKLLIDAFAKIYMDYPEYRLKVDPIVKTLI
ncbi:glycosyltransferase [Bacillus firmus]|uniref:glycosyltransferase n=1 Tax=Cytobacillus firmus TaxID=1399 RepID=UPI001580B480|nr:glycosyltransferase [Cytobacillus firmus]NUH86358.1 glycosyltransferase [Cytobacillus firmus]